MAKLKRTKGAIRPLRSEADYEAALDEIEVYFDNEPKLGTRAAGRFDLLALVIADYENRRWPIRRKRTISLPASC